MAEAAPQPGAQNKRGHRVAMLARRARAKVRVLNPLPVAQPRFGPAPVNPTTCILPEGPAWFPAVHLGAEMIGQLALAPESIQAVQGVMNKISSDDYVRFLSDFYEAGLRQHGQAWKFADLATGLWAAASLTHPRNYLEVGVRRGRSLAVVAAGASEVEITGFDLWLPDYAGMPNPGTAFVAAELARVGHRGRLDLIAGDSHVTLPRHLAHRPDLHFDLITIDGDHSERGASLDLRQALPRLTVGGVIVFDDIAHPKHRRLARVWERFIVSQDRFDAWQFTAMGFGVGIGVRKY